MNESFHANWKTLQDVVNNRLDVTLMPVKFVDTLKVGFMPVLEAEEGFLLCGRTVSDGAVFDHFHEALACMNAEIADNRKAFRKVKVAKVVLFEGKLSCAVNVREATRGGET